MFIMLIVKDDSDAVKNITEISMENPSGGITASI